MPHAPGEAEIPPPVLQEDQLLQRVGGSRELLKEIARMFLEDAPRMLGAVRQAVGGRNASELERSAHALKSAVSNFTMGPATKAADALEQMGRAGDLADAESVLTGLEQSLAAVQLELGSYASLEAR